MNEQLEKLYKVQVMESRQELFSKHTKPLIDHLKETVNMWSVHSTERLVFDTVLIECGKSTIILKYYTKWLIHLVHYLMVVV